MQTLQLAGLVLARPKDHRLKPVLLNHASTIGGKLPLNFGSPAIVSSEITCLGFDSAFARISSKRFANSFRLGIPINNSMGNFAPNDSSSECCSSSAMSESRPRLLSDSSGSSSGDSSAITCAKLFCTCARINPCRCFVGAAQSSSVEKLGPEPREAFDVTGHPFSRTRSAIKDGSDCPLKDRSSKAQSTEIATACAGPFFSKSRSSTANACAGARECITRDAGPRPLAARAAMPTSAHGPQLMDKHGKPRERRSSASPSRNAFAAA
jgi:hypothetical protein